MNNEAFCPKVLLNIPYISLAPRSCDLNYNNISLVQVFQFLAVFCKGQQHIILEQLKLEETVT